MELGNLQSGSYQSSRRLAAIMWVLSIMMLVKTHFADFDHGPSKGGYPLAATMACHRAITGQQKTRLTRKA